MTIVVSKWQFVSFCNAILFAFNAREAAALLSIRPRIILRVKNDESVCDGVLTPVVQFKRWRTYDMVNKVSMAITDRNTVIL